MSGLLTDLRFTLRLMLKRPTTSLVIVVTLAVGIAANTVMFAGFDTWALRPLPFNQPESLFTVVESHPSTGKTDYSVSPANLDDWQLQQQSFTDIAAYTTESFNFHNEDEPERVYGAAISANLFPLLGIEPVKGRGFRADEARPGGPAVALIGDTLWKQRFAADPEVVGKTFRLDGKVRQVIGVMPPSFKFPRFAEVWIPLTHDPSLVPRDQRTLRTIARLDPTSTPASARQEMSAIAGRLELEYPETNDGWTADVLPLRDELVPKAVQIALAASMGSAFLVLLIICANVANLMLAQATSRTQETAVRSALGASRWRLIRQMLTESMLLALLAGGLGAVMGKQLLNWVSSWVPIEPPYMFVMRGDGRALIYTLLISLISGLVCGLAPILRSSGFDIFSTLKSGSQRTGETRGGSRLRSLLVVAEVGMSVLLVIGALLMVRSYLNRQTVEPGYRINSILTMRLSLTSESFADQSRRTSFLNDALAAIGQYPGVEAVGASNHLPESSTGFQRVRLEVEGKLRQRGEEIESSLYSVTQGYLECLEIPLLFGRDFSASEHADGGDVILISESLAASLWPDDSGVGHRIRLIGSEPSPWLTVVGVVGTVDPGHRMVESGTRPRSQVYVPYAEALTPLVSLAIRSTAEPMPLATSVRRQLAAIDAGVSVSDILTMDHAIDEVQWVARYFSKQLSLYAALALAIAALGVYGITADSVARRRREMGIRLALGASPQALARIVLKHGLTMGGAGVCLGVVTALPLTGLISATLFAVDARDPLVFAGVALLLTLIAGIACYLPARRAARIDPNQILRFE